MNQIYKKISLTITIIALFFIYGAITVFAVPPATQYTPAEILDPACAPGAANCSVTTGWQFDTANGYVYNDTDFIGIGTDAPLTALHIDGDITQESTFMGGVGRFFSGDISLYGGDEGYVNIIADDLLAPVGVGLTTLTLDAGDPEYRIYVDNGTNAASFSMDSLDGGISIRNQGTQSIDIHAAGTGDVDIESDVDVQVNAINNIGLYADNEVYLQADANAYINTEQELFTVAQGAWRGGVNDGTTDAGTYRSDFSHDPYAGTPAIVWELKNNQNYAMGFAALDQGFKKYANIYYGELDAGNIIEDITRIEATETGANTMFMYDRPNDYRNYFEVTSIGIEMETEDISGQHYFRLETDGDVYASVLEGGATTLSVDANGNIIRTPSDEKLKTNIEELDGSLERVMQLNPVTYTWKDPQRFGEQIEIGFIAQEIEEIVPEVVRSGGEYKSVNYQVLTALNAGAIKELAQQVNDRAGALIDSVKEIFVRKVTTEELCIGEVCFDEDEARILKEIVTEDGYEFSNNKSDDSGDENEYESDEEIVQDEQEEEVEDENLEETTEQEQSDEIAEKDINDGNEQEETTEEASEGETEETVEKEVTMEEALESEEEVQEDEPEAVEEESIEEQVSEEIAEEQIS